MKKCIACNDGDLTPGTSVFTADRDGVLVVVRKVPALVCDTCEEDYFDETVTESLLKTVEDAVKNHGEVVIRDYHAA